MAKRLIDADALISELVKLQYSEQTMGIMYSQYPHFQAIVERQPTVDAVEVVRCYQCKHFGRNAENDTYCSARNGLSDPEPDDFCSYGERKGGQAPQREDV